jgi:hypothetical protein
MRTPTIKPEDKHPSTPFLSLDAKSIFDKHAVDGKVDNKTLIAVLNELYNKNGKNIDQIIIAQEAAAIFTLCGVDNNDTASITFEQFCSQAQVAKGKHVHNDEEFDLDVQFGQSLTKKERLVEEMKDDKEDVSL